MININDPRITAYLLGELDPQEVEVIEQALRSNATLARNVEQMRLMMALLKDTLPKEPLPNGTAGTQSTEQNQSELLYKRWITFAWKSILVLSIGLTLYYLCLPSSAPIRTPHIPIPSDLSSSTDETDTPTDIQEPQFVIRQQSDVEVWKEYGLTKENISGGSVSTVNELPKN